MAATAAWKWMTGLASTGRRRNWTRSLALGVATLALAPAVSIGGVLTESDFRKVETIKPLFQNLMGDLVQTLKRPDLSTGDADCINGPDWSRAVPRTITCLG